MSDLNPATEGKNAYSIPESLSLSREGSYYLRWTYASRRSENWHRQLEYQRREWERREIDRLLERARDSTRVDAVKTWLALREFSRPPSFEHLTDSLKTSPLSAFAYGATLSERHGTPRIRLHSILCPPYGRESKPLRVSRILGYARHLAKVMRVGSRLISSYTIHTLSGHDYFAAPYLRTCLYPSYAIDPRLPEDNYRSVQAEVLPLLNGVVSDKQIVQLDHDLSLVEPFAVTLARLPVPPWRLSILERVRATILRRYYKPEVAAQYGITEEQYLHNMYLYPATCQCYREVQHIDNGEHVVIVLGLERNQSWYYRAPGIDYTRETPDGRMALLVVDSALRQPWR